jgi:hypothetical protein
VMNLNRFIYKEKGFIRFKTFKEFNII